MWKTTAPFIGNPDYFEVSWRVAFQDELAIKNFLSFYPAGSSFFSFHIPIIFLYFKAAFFQDYCLR
jgi:hypothetical protein